MDSLDRRAVWYDGFWWRIQGEGYNDMSCYLIRDAPDGYQYGCRVSLSVLAHIQQTQARDGLCSVYHVSEGL